MDGVLRVGADERVAGPSTPGMNREQALAAEDLWAGYVTTEPGMVSGWHHHGGHRTVFYVLSGRIRVEFGTGPSDVVEAGPGDFVLVPESTVHREGNPSAETSSAVVFRVGSGESVFDAEPPGPSASGGSA